MSILDELITYADPERAKNSAWFFKTGPGQYGEGDMFLGVRVPDIRRVARLHRDAPLVEVGKLLRNEWHEARLLAVIVLVMKYKRGDAALQKEVYECYMANTRYINNWDIVDSSARQIVGAHLYVLPNGRTLLRELTTSSSMWERRIAMIATSYWLAKGKPEPTIEIAELLLDDTEDLMHKAVGWMLREMGKRVSPEVLRNFLIKYAATMPRTTLRYAIEHFDPKERAEWLAKRARAGVS